MRFTTRSRIEWPIERFAEGYNIYRGRLGEWYDHGSGSLFNQCDVFYRLTEDGRIQTDLEVGEGNVYFLVTGFAEIGEGPSGFSSDGSEIPPEASTCQP